MAKRLVCAAAVVVVLAIGLQGLAVAGEPPKAVPPVTDTVYAVVPLTFLTAGQLAYRLGSQFSYLDAQGQFRPAAPGAATEAGLSSFLPAGLTLVAAASPEARQLLIAGTPTAVAEMQAWLKLVDRKPQQVILEMAVHTTSPKNAQAAPGAPYQFPGADQVTASMRVATLNLLPALNVVTVEDPSRGTARQEVLCLTPRVNGDGTITVSVSANITETGAAALRRDASGVVNVRSGESFLFALPEAGRVAVITATLPKEEPGG